MPNDMTLQQYVTALERAEEDTQRAISELQSKLAEIQIAKKHARAIAADSGISVSRAQKAKENDTVELPSVEQPYRGMSNPDAALAYLKQVGTPQKTAQIARALEKGGIGTDAKNFPATIFGTMRRLVEEGRAVKVGTGLWGLPADAANRTDGQMDLETKD